MSRPTLPLVLMAALTGYTVFGQGLTTTATKDDWEEINFAFDSATLVDGYPSLLRLSELLGKNPTYKVRLSGHTDWHGSKKYNQKLGDARAKMVKSFLEKYGARPSQIELTSVADEKPKSAAKNVDADFMNRRVEVTVLDGNGKPVSAGGVGSAIQSLENTKTMGEQCCSEVLKRLDKLDDILAALRALKTENESIKQQLAAMGDGMKKVNGDVANMKDKMAAPSAPPVAPMPPMPPVDSSKSSNYSASNGFGKKFSLLGLNAGPTADGKLTFTGKGRFFNPFNENLALQSEAEYMYFRDRKEGQFDIGLVDRYKNFQLGLFSSFKHVTFNQFQSGGTMGQAAFTADYIFKRGKLGLFGTKAFMDNAIVNHAVISRNIFEDTYLKVVDQIGAQTTVALYKDFYAEANLAYLKSRSGNDKPGGTIRLVKPINQHVAVSVEGGFNETQLTKNANGRVAFGVLFGNFIRPSEYGDMKGPIPVDIPRVRYELLTRRTRTGNDPPVADAGPDQIGNDAGAVSLDGSGSYDPEGDPITYQWLQIAGPAVTLTGATSVKAGFTSAESQTYGFRLTVKDSYGSIGTARVNITTKAPQAVRILRFAATPATIRSGATSVINWQVENADTVEITNLGRVDARQGSSQVSPPETTTYKLTAKNKSSEANETITVTVEKPAVRILSFSASPTNINAGDRSTLSWTTENADTVELQTVGNVNPNGSAQVSPVETTTYRLTARNKFGEVSSSTTITLNKPVVVPPGGDKPLPRIIRFDALPQEITLGQASGLNWVVENADTVVISSLGTVPLTGTRQVGPQINTIYTITATNVNGQVSSTVGINVLQVPVAPKPVQLTSCSISPSLVAKPGDSAQISFTALNATAVTLNGLGVTSPVTVNPSVDTTYVLTAYGDKQLTTANCSVSVKIASLQPQPVPIANAGPDVETIYRELIIDGGQSSDPNGLPLTYSWKVINKSAAILEPNAARTRVQLGSDFGTYIFELTVTNSKGLSSATTVRVNFVSTRQL